MQLLTQTIRKQLLANNLLENVLSIPPVVKLFTPDAGATWLIVSMEADGDTLYGLCDLGLGFPELGTVSLKEIHAIRGRFGLPVERDIHTTFDKTLGEYADLANSASHITV